MQDSWRVWKTIVIGGMASEMLVRKIKEPFELSSCARDLVRHKKFTVLPARRNIQLVRVSVPDLGFDVHRVYPSTESLYHTARERRLYICPPEVGIYLRQDYADQLKDENLSVAMEQIEDSYGYPRIFMLTGHYLGTNYAPPGDVWHYTSDLVFTTEYFSPAGV